MPAPSTHAFLSDTRIAAVFNALLGMSPRQVDIQVVPLMGATPHSVAEYIWDHWLGEPEEPTVEYLEREIDRILVNDTG
jgi:hypothetical protein